jgi:hypothetical protein
VGRNTYIIAVLDDSGEKQPRRLNPQRLGLQLQLPRPQEYAAAISTSGEVGQGHDGPHAPLQRPRAGHGEASRAVSTW